jgi:N4-gp56 family major capsid protein
MASMTYGDLTPRQANFAVAAFLKRALPMLTIEKFGKQVPLPKNETKTIKMRQYFLSGGTGGYSGAAGNYNLPVNLTPLTEGVTKASIAMAYRDVSVDIAAYGDWVGFTDYFMDTHPDVPAVVSEFSDVLGEQAALTKETLTYNVLKAGTNVAYANGTQRSDVNTPITLAGIRKAVRILKNQNIGKITSVLASTVAYNTQPVEASYICLVHPNVEADIRNIAGFISVAKYAPGKAYEGELGSVEEVRFVSSTVFTAFADAGGAKGTMMSTTGTSADVYPLLFLGKDAFSIVPLRGNTATGSAPASVAVVYPKVTETDPHGQRGIMSWKMYHAAVITNPFALLRFEAAATA